MQPAESIAPSRRLLWLGPGDAGIFLPELLDGTACGELAWERSPVTGHWHATVALGALAAGTLCIPNAVIRGRGLGRYRMQCHWAGGGRLNLVPIAVGDPSQSAAAWPAADSGTVEAGGRAAIGGLDCFEARDDLEDVTLEVEAVNSDGPPELDLAVSIRPRRLASIVEDGAETPTLAVPPLSQMACHADIARHVCSPVSVAMILAALHIQVEPNAFAAACRHPQHRLFGIWPANLAAAFRAGAGGVIRTFDCAADAARLLRRGHPIVTSIRFESGGLPGAPLDRTGGHLVVLRGLGSRTVTVNDPAAADAGCVSLEYDRAAFLEAWLRERGAGYILWPLAALTPEERMA